MITQSLFLMALMLATLLCLLVTGFILVFAIVVMPGIGTLRNRDFLRAFQVMDRIIQNNQPLFVFIWIGSAVALMATAALGIGQLDGVQQLLIIVAASAYLAGAQLPTVAINIPLNNRLQTLDLDALDKAALAAERTRFEPRWNRWNAIRTAFATLASVLLTVLLMMQ